MRAAQNEGQTFIYAALHSALPTFLFDGALDVVFGKHADMVKDYYKVRRKARPGGRDASRVCELTRFAPCFAAADSSGVVG